MRLWLRKNWHRMVTNFAGGSILVILWLQANMQSHSMPFDPWFEQTGRWSIRFLLICLTMTPAHKLFGWRPGLKLRKPVGLWAFAFAALHVVEYAQDYAFALPFTSDWLRSEARDFVLLGAGGFLILAVLTITSNAWAMRLMKKWWKRLHRLVYVAAVLCMTHGIIAAVSTKKAFVRRSYVSDAAYTRELHIYLVILVVLLSLRVPLVMRGVQYLIELPKRFFLRRKRHHPMEVPLIERYIEESELLDQSDAEAQSVQASTAAKSETACTTEQSQLLAAKSPEKPAMIRKTEQ